jgi:uncharacterized coiled-coil protein SlyX
MQPALDALTELRTDILKRIGQEGGNLNKRMRSNLNTVGLALQQFSTIVAMNNTIAQQSQVIAKVTNDLSRDMSRLLTASEHNGDDGTSETKGE